MEQFACRKVFPFLDHNWFLCTDVGAQRGSIVDQQIDLLVEKHSTNTAVPIHKASKVSEVSKMKQKLERKSERF